MISEKTMDAVYPLVEKLHQKGIQVAPINNTPLGTLVNASSMPPTRDLAHLDAAELLMYSSRAAGPDGVVQHDLVMDEIVEVVAQTVRNNLQIARTVVNPVVKDTAERAKEIMDANMVAKVHQLTVRPFFYHSLWSTPTLAEMVDRYRETAVQDMKLYLELPRPTSEEGLVALARTGARRFDGLIEEWFNALDPDLIDYVWTGVFQAGQGGSRQLLDFLRPSTQDMALLIHLFARRLLQDPPEGTGVGVQEYRDYMAQIVAQSGRTVVAVMRRREQDIRRKVLITSFPYSTSMIASQPQEIQVNGDLYNQWLKEGGSPEALFGSFITAQETTYQSLLAEKETFEKAWERKERLLETHRRGERFNYGRDALQKAITEQINAMEEDDLVVERKLLHERLQKEVTQLTGRFYEDWYHTARTLVCRVIYPHTDAYRVLTAIDEVCKDHPDIEVREAALLATIELVGTWVAKLCRVDFVTPPSA